MNVLLRSSLVRGALLFFWFAVIVGFLFFPRLLTLVRSPKSINVYTFPLLLDVDYLTVFEQETGIKVYVSYYESNDELLVKMRQTGGEGYDLIIPSDYVIDTLVKEGLVQPLDKTQLPFWHDLEPRLLGHYFDPTNEYSIPYFWALYGMGINKKYFGGKVPQATWELLFKEHENKYRIGMINNAREAILLAAFYLFGTIHDLDESKIEQIKALLIKQKKWVQVYTDIGPESLLLSESCPVVASLSGEVWQAKRSDDAIEFIVPQEGSFMVIDNIAIPAKNTNPELTYKFINFLYRPRTLRHHIDFYSAFPPLVTGEVSETKEASGISLLSKLPTIHFFENVVSDKVLQDVWLALKAY